MWGSDLPSTRPWSPVAKGYSTACHAHAQELTVPPTPKPSPLPLFHHLQKDRIQRDTLRLPSVLDALCPQLRSKQEQRGISADTHGRKDGEASGGPGPAGLLAAEDGIQRPPRSHPSWVSFQRSGEGAGGKHSRLPPGSGPPPPPTSSLQRHRDQSWKGCAPQRGRGAGSSSQCATSPLEAQVPETGSPAQAPGTGPLQPRGLVPWAPAASSTSGPLDVHSDLPEVHAGHRGVRARLAASHHFAARSSGPRRASD